MGLFSRFSKKAKFKEEAQSIVEEIFTMDLTIRNVIVTPKAQKVVSKDIFEDAMEKLEIIFPDYVEAIDQYRGKILIINSEELKLGMQKMDCMAAGKISDTEAGKVYFGIMVSKIASNLNSNERSWALAHELVHLGQMLTGKFKVVLAKDGSVKKLWEDECRLTIAKGEKRPDETLMFWELEANMMNCPTSIKSAIKNLGVRFSKNNAENLEARYEYFVTEE